MSALTHKERAGLDEVFLSIHSDKYQRIKIISFLIVRKRLRVSSCNLFKVAKYGLKATKKLNFIVYLTKKKKKLSK